MAKTPKKPKEKPNPQGQLPTGKLAISKDPRVYADSIPRLVAPHKRIVGLDLGTTTGVAFCDIVPGHPVKQANIVMGQWDLSVGQYDTGPLQHVRLQQFLAVLGPSIVMFEDVKFVGDNRPMAKGSLTAIIARVAHAAEFIGGLKQTVANWCLLYDVPCEGVPIATIKRFGTGKGNANKVDMINACNEQFGTNFDPEGYESSGVDNIADAAFVCALGVTNYSEGL